MKDQNKMKAQLIQELAELRQSFAELKKTETKSKHIKEDLKASEKKYRFLYQNSPAINIIVGTDGLIKDINKSVVVNLGYSRDEAIGKYVLDFVVPEQKEKVSTQLAKDFKGEYTPEIDVDVYAKDGSIHTILFLPGQVLLHKGDQPTGVLFTAIDITRRLSAERVGKQAENRIVHLNSLLKAIRNVNQLVVVEKDIDRLFRKVCDILIETRGYNAAWIGFSGDEKTFSIVKGSGFITGVSRFIKQVISGDHPHCIKKALAQKEKILIIDKSGTCGDCFFKDACTGKEAAVIRIEHEGRLLGLIAVLLTPNTSIDDEESILLQEVADDIAFAIHDMEMEKRRKQAEKSLKKSEAKLRNILENSTNLFYSHTPEHIITYLSPQVKNILGYTQEEAMIKWTELASDNPINEIGFKHTVKAIETGKPQPPYELELVHKSGEKLWVEVREAPVVEDGKTVSIVGALTNITERKQAELALQRSEEKYRSLIESSVDPIYLINRDLEYIYANKELLSRFGKSGSQVFGHRYEEFHTPEGLKMFSEIVKELFKTKKNLAYEYQSHRDGKHFLRTLSPILHTDTGEVTAITVISKDITYLKQTEEKMLMANERLQHLLYSSTTVIYSCETSGDYGVTYSSENVFIITGYLSFNFIKDPKFWIDHIHPEDREFVLEKVSTISKTENLEVEYRFRKKEGEYIWLHDTKKLRRDEHGTPVEIVGSLLDVTERKQAVKALEESEKNFRVLVENSFDGIMINDISGNYLYSNKSAAEISGYSVDELLKLNVKELTPSKDVKKVMERIKNRK